MRRSPGDGVSTNALVERREAALERRADRFNRGAGAGSWCEVQQHGAALILGEFELDPGVEPGDVDASHLRGPLRTADRETALIQQVEPRFPGQSAAGRDHSHRDTFVMLW